MSSTKQNRRLIGTFIALATFALGISCTGFFQNPTLTSVSISPAAPAVQQGQTQQLQLFGTYNDGSRNQVTSGVSWSSSDPTVASVGTTSGLMQGLQTGSTTITADAQGLSTTAAATVFLTITAITITPQSASISGGTTASGTIPYTVKGTVNRTQMNISSGATVVANNSTGQEPTISCSFNSADNAQDCTATNTPAGTYSIVATYTGSSLTATASLTVQ